MAVNVSVAPAAGSASPCFAQGPFKLAPGGEASAFGSGFDQLFAAIVAQLEAGKEPDPEALAGGLLPVDGETLPPEMDREELEAELEARLAQHPRFERALTEDQLAELVDRALAHLQGQVEGGEPVTVPFVVPGKGVPADRVPLESDVDSSRVGGTGENANANAKGSPESAGQQVIGAALKDGADGAKVKSAEADAARRALSRSESSAVADDVPTPRASNDSLVGEVVDKVSGDIGAATETRAPGTESSEPGRSAAGEAISQLASVVAGVASKPASRAVENSTPSVGQPLVGGLEGDELARSAKDQAVGVQAAVKSDAESAARDAERTLPSSDLDGEAKDQAVGERESANSGLAVESKNPAVAKPDSAVAQPAESVPDKAAEGVEKVAQVVALGASSEGAGAKGTAENAPAPPVGSAGQAVERSVSSAAAESPREPSRVNAAPMSNDSSGEQSRESPRRDFAVAVNEGRNSASRESNPEPIGRDIAAVAKGEGGAPVREGPVASALNTLLSALPQPKPAAAPINPPSPGQFQALYPAAQADPASLMLPQRLGSERWSAALSQRLVMMTNQRLSAAEIRLDPPELGSLHVRLSVNQDQASLSFSSPHAHVRDALEQQMPRLREMLAESGLNLQESDVSDQGFGRERGQSDEGWERGTDGFADDAEIAVAATQNQALSLVDAYA